MSDSQYKQVLAVLLQSLEEQLMMLDSFAEAHKAFLQSEQTDELKDIFGRFLEAENVYRKSMLKAQIDLAKFDPSNR